MSLEINIREVSNRYSRFSIERVMTELKTKADDELKAETEVTEELSKGDKADSLINQKQPDLDYSFSKEELAARLYDQQKLDYQKLDYQNLLSEENKNIISLGAEEEYWSKIVPEDTKAETMTNKEAEEMVQHYQVSMLSGTLSDLSYIERKRFALWVIINPTERGLFHKLHAFTDDVDYSKTY